MRYQFVQVERQERVGILRLNRPECLNAFHAAMIREMPVALHELLDDEGVHTVIISGNGKGFCAGADVNHLYELVTSGKIAEGEALVTVGSQVVEMIDHGDKPVIAAINGPAMGAGASIALACDMRLIAQSATIGFPFVRIGLHPDLGCTYFLPRLVGPAKAAELLMSGETVNAGEARQLGLVNRVLEDAELMLSALALARTMSEKPAETIRLLKKGLRQTHREPLEKVLKYEIYAQKLCFASDAARALLQQFLESRRKG